MTIFKIVNLSAFKPDYVSDDESIVIANTGNNQVNSIVLGNASTALTILETNQKIYLDQQAFRLSVNKETVDGSNTLLSGITPATELKNDSQVYNVFNDLTGSYIQVIGTTAMLIALESVKTQILAVAGLSSYTVVDSIPKTLNKQPPTTGTQTL